MDKTCEDATDMPRLCQVLGVAVGERFKVRDDMEQKLLGMLSVTECGTLVAYGGLAPVDAIYALTQAINHPEKIIRVPRLTPEEVQRCRAFGAKWISCDADDCQVWLWEERPELKPNGVWDGGTSCAQAWARFFPSVQPGQLIQVEDEP